jgi:hypothetical protein
MMHGQTQIKSWNVFFAVFVTSLTPNLLASNSQLYARWNYSRLTFANKFAAMEREIA